jgi:hypothetical protein
MKTIRWMVLLGVLLVGCDGGGGEQASETPGHQTSHGGTLTLNDGQKWVMDDHTRKMIAEIRSTVDGAAVADLEGAHSLGDTLQAKVNRLVQGCTMEGAAHDQLHVFLSQFIPAAGAMVSASSAQSGQESLERIRDLLAEYDRTFR